MTLSLRKTVSFVHQRVLDEPVNGGVTIEPIDVIRVQVLTIEVELVLGTAPVVEHGSQVESSRRVSS